MSLFKASCIFYPSRLFRLAACCVGIGLFLSSLTGAAENPPASPWIGRWDLTVEGKEGTFPSWLEVKLSGYHTLVGQYVGQFGSARPVAKFETQGDQIRFTIPPQWEKRSDDQVFEAKIKGDEIVGETTDEQGRTIRWTGRRAPNLERMGEVIWGQPMELFNGKDLTGWRPMFDTNKVPNGWTVQDGVLVNAKPGNNLITEAKFEDFQLHAEFRYAEKSNGGIYLRGRYEVQIEDNFGGEAESHKIGGVYGFLTPSLNVAKRANEWQTYEITLVGRQVTVVLNGERVIDRQTIPGITGGALDSDEGTPGPIYLQGDHGPVEFRKLTLTPAISKR